MNNPLRAAARILVFLLAGLALPGQARCEDLIFAKDYDYSCFYTPWCGGTVRLPVDAKYSRCRACVQLSSDASDYEAIAGLRCLDGDGQTFTARARSSAKKCTEWLERGPDCFDRSGWLELMQEPRGPWGFTRFKYRVEVLCE
ncbi:MAG: hypothetical protein PHV85_01080 [Desulfovibrionaceae bacterium]|nr:hypothetical protein [Desulfovibrionaceae bacterium]